MGLPVQAVIASVVVAVVAVLGWLKLRHATIGPGAAIEKELPPLIETLQDEEKRLASLLLWSFREYRQNARTWSFGYHGLIIASAVSSAFAGVVLKLNVVCLPEDAVADVAALLAACAALFITIVSTIGFERKWQANRIAAAEVEALTLEYLSRAAEPRRDNHSEVGKKLSEVSLKRNQQIAGD